MDDENKELMHEILKERTAEAHRLRPDLSKMIAARMRGHLIYLDGEVWRYVDNDEPTVETHGQRPCGQCGEHRTPEGHDPCIGTLPGVMNACCGHGNAKEAYVQIDSSRDLRGSRALNYFKIYGRHVP